MKWVDFLNNFFECFKFDEGSAEYTIVPDSCRTWRNLYRSASDLGIEEDLGASPEASESVALTCRLLQVGVSDSGEEPAAHLDLIKNILLSVMLGFKYPKIEEELITLFKKVAQHDHSVEGLTRSPKHRAQVLLEEDLKAWLVGVTRRVDAGVITPDEVPEPLLQLMLDKLKGESALSTAHYLQRQRNPTRIRDVARAREWDDTTPGAGGGGGGVGPASAPPNRTGAYESSSDKRQQQYFFLRFLKKRIWPAVESVRVNEFRRTLHVKFGVKTAGGMKKTESGALEPETVLAAINEMLLSRGNAPLSDAEKKAYQEAYVRRFAIASVVAEPTSRTAETFYSATAVAEAETAEGDPVPRV